VKVKVQARAGTPVGSGIRVRDRLVLVLMVRAVSLLHRQPALMFVTLDVHLVPSTFLVPSTLLVPSGFLVPLGFLMPSVLLVHSVLLVPSIYLVPSPRHLRLPPCQPGLCIGPCPATDRGSVFTD
jgi:hypothetical protein